MTLYLGNNLISGTQTLVGESRNIGQIIPSTIPLTDAGLHLLDGALIDGNGVYSAFVTYIAGLVSDYPSLFETEANWQTAVTTYGVCGKFVYDSVANTVRLPKITGILEGTTDLTALGDLVQAGLPNVTSILQSNAGLLASVDTNFTQNTGALTASDFANTPITRNANGNYPRRMTLDLSKGNSIYGNSATVQPQTIKVLYYIVIATSTKTDIEVDIDEIATDLNGKADVDLTNITNTGNVLMAHNAMPSGTTYAYTTLASGSQYTAPADGWFYVQADVTGSGYLSLSGPMLAISQHAGGNSVFMPIRKGQKLTLVYSNASNIYVRFKYAQGSISEAS